MFAVAKNFGIQEAKRAFRLFVCWSVRFLVVGGRGGFLDTNYARVAHEVGKGNITTAKQLKDFMADVVPTDAVFEAAFAEARVEKGLSCAVLSASAGDESQGRPAAGISSE